MKSALITFFTPFGRANRIVFLAGFGLLMLVPSALQFVMTVLTQTGVLPRPDAGNLLVALPGYFYFNLLLSAWMVFCLFANRLHDLGRTAVWALIPALIPMLGMGVLSGFKQHAFGWGVIGAMFMGPVLYTAAALLLLCFKGNPAPNQFGARPDFASAR